MPEVWRLLELSRPEDPAWNMALDASLLDAAESNSNSASHGRADEKSPAALPTLRFYQWSKPALSIGYFQSVEKTVRAYDCQRQNLWVVRRPTGGGLVRHGSDLTLSFTVSENHPRLAGKVSDSYRAVHAVLREALLPVFPDLTFSACAAPLKARSERLCFEEPVACDLERGGEKVVGSSQRRKNGRLLHQTSIQLPGDPQEMARRIAAAFETHWNLRLSPSVLTDTEKKSAEAARATAAASAEWTFSPVSRSTEKSPIFS